MGQSDKDLERSDLERRLRDLEKPQNERIREELWSIDEISWLDEHFEIHFQEELQETSAQLEKKKVVWRRKKSSLFKTFLFLIRCEFTNDKEYLNTIAFMSHNHCFSVEWWCFDY